jgi:hypothetical protein
MTDATVIPLPMWQRILNNQRFQGLLWNAIKVLGIPALPFVQKWFPGTTVDTIGGDIVLGVPFVVGCAADWYRAHPDNILARAIKVINGGSASAAAVAKVGAAIIAAKPA